MFTEVKIAPSILSADFMHMADSINLIERAGAGFVHVDVMDGHFVPNLTMGVPLVKQLKKFTSLPLDVHLMISNPQMQIPWFIDAGADIISYHFEAIDSLDEQVKLIHTIQTHGAKACVAIKPKTAVDEIQTLIPLVDMVLIMSVEPGFSGQSYIVGSEDKVAQVVNIAKSSGVSPLIEVDGGIGLSTAPLVCAAGADVLVCGNAVYAAEDPAAALKEIQMAGNGAVNAR